MSQLNTLIWLKWLLLKNSLRSSKAVVNQLATLLGMSLALGVALAVSIGLGFAAYALSNPQTLAELFRESARKNPNHGVQASAEFLFFSIFAFIYLMWASLPLSLGSSKQFDAGRLLMYPISLRKLFAVDFVSEVTTLQSVFAIPAIFAMAIGAGLGSGDLIRPLVAAVPACLFGMALSKWLSTMIGSLFRHKRARGETILAFVGVIAGLGAALVGQLAPLIFKYAESLRGLRWTPPGAAAFLIASGARADNPTYLLFLAILSAYSAALIVGTYWISRRAALDLGGSKRRARTTAAVESSGYVGWQIPLLSSELSAIVEKELRYVMRNAQLRMMAFMPLILIAVRAVNYKRFGSVGPGNSGPNEFLIYGSGLIVAGGVLYVFLLLAGLSCNQFAFEEGGMRTLILAPIDRRKILVGKNIALSIVALFFSILLLIVNAFVFRDLTPLTLLFVALSMITYAANISIFGNWLSIKFPKRMQFGKRLNVSGVSGLLFIPLLVLLAAPPVVATLAGYFTKNLMIEYLTLAAFVGVLVPLYAFAVRMQGHSLQVREVEILDAIIEPTDK